MKDRPNIVWFVSDDHAPWSLQCYGNRALRTPGFDWLARHGTVFDNAFTPCPVCSPGRACLMTGRTPSLVGIHDWLEEADPGIGSIDWLARETTLPQLLHAAGYHTALSGKWHLGQSHRTPRGFVRSFGLPGAQGGHNESYEYHLDGQRLRLAGNKSRHITDHALAFLAEAPAEQPFFLNIGYIATHSPYEASAHDPAAVRAVGPVELGDYPVYVPHPWRKDEGFDYDCHMGQDIVSRQTGYYAAVHEIDRELARVIDWLRDHGKLDSTLLVYVSDHGCAIGHHGFWGKGNSTRPLNMYDVSLRVPLLIAGCGVAPGARVAHCVDHYDLFRALVEWAGARLPDGAAGTYPGRSLAALATGACGGWCDTRYGEYGDLRMIRTREFKFVKRYPEGPHDLFDLRADPGETLNLCGLPSHEGIRAILERELEEWYERYQDPARSGLNVKQLPRHNVASEAWRDGRREAAGFQVY